MGVIATAFANLGQLLDTTANLLYRGIAQGVERPLDQKLLERVSVADFGAKGDNITDDTAAINAAVAWCNSQTFPRELYFPPGQYRMTAAMTPISKPLVLAGDGPRCAILVFSGGGYDCITFAGVTSRVANGGVRGMGFYCSDMTGGTFLTVDWAQDMVFRDILVAGAYNFAYVRQAGNTTFDCIDAQPIRGAYGLKWYGTGATRNGEQDKSDVLEMKSTILGGNLVPNERAGTVDLIWLDGFVQTFNFHRLQLFNSKHAIYTSNTPGLAYPHIPSFVIGSDLEIENSTEDGIHAEVLNTMNVSGLFCAGSVMKSGIYLGPYASMISLTGGRSNTHALHGVHIDGACNVTLTGMALFNNSHQTHGVASGVRVVAGTMVALVGCTAGAPAGAGTFDNHQAYGIDNVGGLRVSAVATDFNGNVVAGKNGALESAACFGL
ncbi:hypothetical protein AS593_20895 [Caulobacter vibrioides]|nr:hypothetical protein AS593_20895 [Caulobacter vibrioides]